MTEIETIIRNDTRRVSVTESGVTIEDPFDRRVLGAVLNPEQRKAMAKALDRGVETGYALQVDALARERDALGSQLARVDMECAEAHRELEWSRKDRDRLDEGVREANARADAAEAKVRELREQVQRSGSIVYTVEEQDIEAEGRRVEVVDTGRQFNIRIQGQPVNAIKSSTEAREKAQRHIEAAARCEAIARRIETDTAVDPVEEKTDALADILYGHEMVTDQMRGVLERVVRAGMLLPEQEASSDE